jgi:integrase
LHGTWSLDAEGAAERTFFVWAERMAPLPAEPTRRATAARGGIRRHPYAATALEIAHLLEALTPGTEWRGCRA